MKILLVSPEVSPFAKTGGLADVAAALPKELARRGHDVRVVMPRYGCVDRRREHLKVAVPEVHVAFRGDGAPTDFRGAVYEGVLPGSSVPVYFVDEPVLFDRPGLYDREGEDYPDNAFRFSFFCKAALQMLKHLDWAPDILHCNDWQTGLIPVFLKAHDLFRGDPFYEECRVLFTVHNLGYQGLFPAQVVAWLGLPWSIYNRDNLEFWGKASFLKGGIAFSDQVSTVSEEYAREIQTPELGCGLDGFLAIRGSRLVGILNGVDYSEWSPESDPLIEKNYSPADMSGKAVCKAALQKDAGLPVRPDVPLFGMISRLDGQKGFDILERALPALMKSDFQLVILGTGHAVYHEFLQKAQHAHPQKIRACLKFDNHLAHVIEAGADAFLMPSRYEPCGLNQLYSLKYGTVPIVRHTGGLADTINAATAATIREGTATGFVFDHYGARELTRAVRHALEVFRDHPDDWKKIQQAGMRKDFSWSRSAGLYEHLFSKMLSEPRVKYTPPAAK